MCSLLRHVAHTTRIPATLYRRSDSKQASLSPVLTACKNIMRDERNRAPHTHTQAQACKQLALARQQYTAAIKRRQRDEGKGRIERGETRRGGAEPRWQVCVRGSSPAFIDRVGMGRAARQLDVGSAVCTAVQCTEIRHTHTIRSTTPNSALLYPTGFIDSKSIAVINQSSSACRVLALTWGGNLTQINTKSTECDKAKLLPRPFCP